MSDIIAYKDQSNEYFDVEKKIETDFPRGQIGNVKWYEISRIRLRTKIQDIFQNIRRIALTNLNVTRAPPIADQTQWEAYGTHS